MITASVLIGVYGVNMVKVMMVRSSAALGIPMGYVYCAIPIGCVGIVIQCLANFTELRDTGTEGEEEVDG